MILLHQSFKTSIWSNLIGQTFFNNIMFQYQFSVSVILKLMKDISFDVKSIKITRSHFVKNQVWFTSGGPMVALCGGALYRVRQKEKILVIFLAENWRQTGSRSRLYLLHTHLPSLRCQWKTYVFYISSSSKKRVK